MPPFKDDLTATHCLNCGTKAKAIAKYCHTCGAPVYHGALSETPPPSQAKLFSQTSTPLVVSTPTPPLSYQDVGNGMVAKGNHARKPEVRIGIKKFRTYSNLKVILLSVGTFGIWPMYCFNRLTSSINVSVDPHFRISGRFVAANFVLAYGSLLLIVLYLLVPEGHPVAVISDLVDWAKTVCFLVWSFKVRNRLNALLQSTVDSTSWFHGVYTFFFTVFYINYKLNQLKKAEATPL